MALNPFNTEFLTTVDTKVSQQQYATIKKFLDVCLVFGYNPALL